MAFRSVDAKSLCRFNSALSSSFLDTLDNKIDSEIQEDNNHIKHKTFAPSSFRCSRLMWFRLRGVQPDPIDKPDKMLKFSAEVGTALHQVYQNYISKMLGDDWIAVKDYLKENPVEGKYTLEEEGFESLLEFTDPYPIRFACDGILRISGEYYLLEIKTSGSDSFRDLRDPKPQHIDQVKCYCAMLGLKKVLYLYIDRTWGDTKCYEYTVKDRDIQEVIQRFSNVMWAAEYNIAPDRLPKGDSWCTSNMCPYYKRCKEW